MSRSKSTTTPPEPSPDPTGRADDPLEYRVVARRYRPQSFEEVVGQDHVVQTLKNAIRLNRVTHAYLFCGTRGVGKTSIARIFAKCLNCEQGPSEKPCNRCDMCEAISVGQDVDVIEIDGASNNGVEQVRELRQNANLRPSRGRYKIYYIDEVHSLSRGAFEALLKTLEEPPEHVKFFFATTEPGKIPETVRSRCQRYDFAGISPAQIAQTLKAICDREGVAADDDALATIARRAAGSMRDAQSMLEQALATEGRHITDQLVHDTLGLAPDERVLELLEAIAQRDAALALKTLDEAASAGVQPGDLLSALLEFLRDVMVLSAGAKSDLLSSAPSARERIARIAKSWSLESCLAALQILAEARARLRGSPHGRLLVELAICRCARLEDLVEIADLVEALKHADPGAPAPLPDPKKKREARADEPQAPTPIAPNGKSAPRPAPPKATPAPSTTTTVAVDFSTQPLTMETFEAAWPILRERLGTPLSGHLGKLELSSVPEPGVLVLGVPSSYNFIADQLQKTETAATIEQALKQLFGRGITLRYERHSMLPAAEPPIAAPVKITKHKDLDTDPFIQDLVQLFDARAVHIQTEDEPDATGPPPSQA